MARETTVKTLRGEDGALFYSESGRIVKFSDCSVSVEIIETAIPIEALGMGSAFKKSHAVAVITFDNVPTPEVTQELADRISRLEVQAHFERADGTFEALVLDNLVPLAQMDLDSPHASWRFESSCSKAMLGKLLTF